MDRRQEGQWTDNGHRMEGQADEQQKKGTERRTKDIQMDREGEDNRQEWRDGWTDTGYIDGLMDQ